VAALVRKAVFIQSPASSINLGTNHPVWPRLKNPVTPRFRLDKTQQSRDVQREAWESLTWWVCGTWC
jgi:hypothetical protein